MQYLGDVLQQQVPWGRGHTNYDIQFIVVILKVTTRFFNNDLGLLEKLSW